MLFETGVSMLKWVPETKVVQLGQCSTYILVWYILA